ncbi:response regulator [Microvirga sp. M2]|uniref:response regulator n=1 Tax=Microvirga sp. M2 TaxID=3073270 RepID=UPI0039C31E2D
MTKILVVDDEFLVAEMIACLLEDEGYEVAQASHGRQALAMIQEERPALVITDFMMPLMTGLELARALKATSGYRDLPIILMSGAQGAIARDHHDLFAAVFDKPFRNGHLLEQVRKLIDVVQ